MAITQVDPLDGDREEDLGTSTKKVWGLKDQSQAEALATTARNSNDVEVVNRIVRAQAKKEQHDINSHDVTEPQLFSKPTTPTPALTQQAQGLGRY